MEPFEMEIVSLNKENNYLRSQLSAKDAELTRLREGHCDDCCCARSWDALGIIQMDGKSIPEHIAALRARMEDVEGMGRIMHELWTRTKRAQGFHHPKEFHADNETMCDKCHWDLCDWSELPEKQKDINRHAFDGVLAWLKEGR
jgi:hypothetical protein